MDFILTSRQMRGWALAKKWEILLSIVLRSTQTFTLKCEFTSCGKLKILCIHKWVRKWWGSGWFLQLHIKRRLCFAHLYRLICISSALLFSSSGHIMANLGYSRSVCESQAIKLRGRAATMRSFSLYWDTDTLLGDGLCGSHLCPPTLREGHLSCA